MYCKKYSHTWGYHPVRFTVLGMLVLFLAGCAQVEYLPPPPTPQVVRLDHSPSVRTWQPALYACAAALPEMALFTREIPATGLDIASTDLILLLGMPQLSSSFYSAQVGEEQIVVITHPDNPLQEVDEAVLRQLYSGQIDRWDAIVPGFDPSVQVWTYSPGDDTRQLFEAALFADSPPNIQGFLAPDPEAMLEAVSAEPGTLGYLPRSWLEQANVTELSLPADLAARLVHPVLAVTDGEPQGAVRSLLSCLQDAQK